LKGRPLTDSCEAGWTTHAFRSATTDDFLAFLKTELMDKQPRVVTDAQLQEWLHSEGIPAFAVLTLSDAFAKGARCLAGWRTHGRPCLRLQGMVRAGVDSLCGDAAEHVDAGEDDRWTASSALPNRPTQPSRRPGSASGSPRVINLPTPRWRNTWFTSADGD
jgi:hypothetical protein